MRAVGITPAIPKLRAAVKRAGAMGEGNGDDERVVPFVAVEVPVPVEVAVEDAVAVALEVGLTFLLRIESGL